MTWWPTVGFAPSRFVNSFEQLFVFRKRKTRSLFEEHEGNNRPTYLEGKTWFHREEKDPLLHDILSPPQNGCLVTHMHTKQKDCSLQLKHRGLQVLKPNDMICFLPPAFLPLPNRWGGYSMRRSTPPSRRT